MELTESEVTELKRLKAYFPFREWMAVKPQTGEFRIFDTPRKAKNYALKHTPATIYAAQ